jgi:hypothetical protein
MNQTGMTRHHKLRAVLGSLVTIHLLVAPLPAFSQDQPGGAQEERKSARMTCGKCQEGYATAGRTTDEKICKEDDHALVTCIPIGSRNQMPVWGSCPEGYVEVGRSLVPALCGAVDGGLRTQCQLPKIEGGMPDPSQGGIFCPPNCPSTDQMPTPGQGTLPSPPQVPYGKEK